MRASKSEQTGSAGVSRVMADFADLDWGPTENVRHDLGIDVFLQVRDERRFDRAVLVAAQVKSGVSYFGGQVKDKARKVTGWWYAEEDARHFENWVQHGLPHLLVLHDPRTHTSYWAHVTRKAVTASGSGFKIFVPATHRVDAANRDALLDVAASAKGAPTFQGTSFTASANAVAPGRALRHALLTPRLIAPHVNTGYGRTLQPEEAIALVTQGRVSELPRFVDQARNAKLAGASAKSRDWRWRFFAAYRELAAGDSRQILELAEAMRRRRKPKEQAYRIAACGVTAAVALADVERWDQAQAVLLSMGEDLPPIDHAWVLVHRAIVLAERGDVEDARALAAAAQRTVSLDADDVTDGAIGAAAAELIFLTTAWGSGKLGDALVAADTAASWWRSETILWALDDHDQDTFKAWASSDDIDAQYSDAAQDRLKGAWLSAALAGDRSAAAEILATRAHHELVHHEVAWRSATADPMDDGGHRARSENAAYALEEALDELRRYGCHRDLEIAAERLWAAGPTIPVRAALSRSLAAPWTHTNARAKFTLLQCAGDLLDTASADEAVRDCLDVIVDPMPFAEQIRPSFSVRYLAHQALRGVLPAAGDAAHGSAIEYVLQSVTQSDSLEVEDDVVRLIGCVRSSAVTTHADQLRTAALNQRDCRLASVMLKALLPGGDPEAEAELISRADAGDIHAVAALQVVTALSPAAASAVVERDAAACRQLVADARGGAHNFGGWDSARALTVVNLAFPALANWDPVVEVVLDPHVAVDDKIGAVWILASRADDLPDEVATELCEAMSTRANAVVGLPILQRKEDLVEAAFALGLALGILDTASAVRRMLTWLRGSASQRQAAGGLLRVLGRQAQDPAIHGALVMLTGDPQYEVRAAAAGALARGATPPVPTVVEEAINAAAREDGCAAPLSVARALAAAPAAWPPEAAARAQLASHASARVRAAATS